MFRQVVSPVILTCLTVPAFAAQIEAPAETSHVTVFSQGAVIEWTVDLTADPGRHDVTLPNIPRNIDAASINVTAEGATIGAVTVQSQPPNPSEVTDSQAITDARTKLREAQEEMTRLTGNIATHEAAAEAWRQRAEMIRDMMRGDARIAVGEFSGLANDAGGLISEYLTNAANEAREASLLTHQQGELQRNQAKAEAALNELLSDQAQSQSLIVTLQQSAPAAKLKLTAYTQQAGWVPAYDLNLTRETGDIALDRGLTVWQGTGSDWQDVTLTFSTARPQGQATPTEVPPYIVEFYEGYDTKSATLSRAAPVAEMDAAASGAYVEEAPSDSVAGSAQLANIGMTVTYNYPTPVTVHSDADALRLALDEKALKSEVLAEVAPRFDATAFVVAEGVNDIGEPILPGNTNLYLDGALVGRGSLPLTAVGDDLHIGFGPIDAITAELQVPQEQEGDSGFISRKNQRIQTETLIVRNLSDKEWPLRIVDRVPVSKQEDLQVTWSATPEPTEQDPDGRRGVLEWIGPIATGETKQITIETDVRWPDGMEVSR